MKHQLKELWQYTQQVAAKELKDTTEITFEQIDPEKINETIKKIDDALKDKAVPKKVQQKIGYAKKNFASNLNNTINKTKY